MDSGKQLTWWSPILINHLHYLLDGSSSKQVEMTCLQFVKWVTLNNSFSWLWIHRDQSSISLFIMPPGLGTRGVMFFIIKYIVWCHELIKCLLWFIFPCLTVSPSAHSGWVVSSCPASSIRLPVISPQWPMMFQCGETLKMWRLQDQDKMVTILRITISTSFWSIKICYIVNQISMWFISMIQSRINQHWFR